MRIGRAVRATFAAAIGGGALLVLTAAPAAAAPDTPPGWTNQAGAYVTFSLSTYSLADGDAVTLSRAYNNTTSPDLLGAFSNWEVTPSGQHGWPTTWSASGVSLTRTSFCDYTASSCAYTVTGVSGSSFWVAAGPTNPDGSPNYPAGEPQTITIPPPTTLPPTTTPPDPGHVVGKVTFTPGTNGAPGTASFDASGSTLPGGAAPTGYRWTLQNVGTGESQTFDCAATPCAPPANIKLDPGATYNVTLALLDAGGAPALSSTAAQLAVPADPTPAPSPPPSGGGTPSGGGGAPSAGGGGGGGVPGVFARPVSRAPTSLTGGGDPGAAYPTVVWLWRPDFYQNPASQQPSTAGGVEVKGKQAIVVSHLKNLDTSNAGPWLAGVGAFGLIGGGFLINRAMRVRRARA